LKWSGWRNVLLEGEKQSIDQQNKSVSVDAPSRSKSIKSAILKVVFGATYSTSRSYDRNNPCTKFATDDPRSAPATTSAGQCLLSTTRLAAIKTATAIGASENIEMNL